MPVPGPDREHRERSQEEGRGRACGSHTEGRTGGAQQGPFLLQEGAGLTEELGEGAGPACREAWRPGAWHEGALEERAGEEVEVGLGDRRGEEAGKGGSRRGRGGVGTSWGAPEAPGKCPHREREVGRV